MGSQSALSVSCERHPIDGCDQELSSLAHEFVACFVRACAGVIAGVKPAAIFSFRCPDSDGRERGRLCELLRALSPALGERGIRLVAVARRRDRLQLLAWRPELVEQRLSDAPTASFLASLGHPTSSARLLMGSLRQALCRYHQGSRSGFPHEVGLVLGYPLEDVQGYMRGATETCRGPWRSYGDATQARQRFRRLAEGERSCRVRYAQGMSLGALLERTPL